MSNPQNATRLLAAITALFCSMSWADGDPEAGAAKATACVACHGQDGNGIDPQYPKLAGQYEDYLLESLRHYKDGRRSNAIMAGFVANLSDEDMEDLAAYYASMETQLSDMSGKD